MENSNVESINYFLKRATNDILESASVLHQFINHIDSNSYLLAQIQFVLLIQYKDTSVEKLKFPKHHPSLTRIELAVRRILLKLIHMCKLQLTKRMTTTTTNQRRQLRSICDSLCKASKMKY